MQVKTIYLINDILYINGFIVIMLKYDYPNSCSLCGNCNNFSKFSSYCYGFYYRDAKNLRNSEHLYMSSQYARRYLCDPCYNKLRLLAREKGEYAEDI